MALNPPSDPSFYLDDGATTHAPAGNGVQTAYGRAGGAARIFSFGTSPWLGFAAFSPSILDLSSTETYQLAIEGSASADFSGPSQELASWMLGALNPQDVIAVSNVHNGVTYPYGRLKITMTGPTPQIRLSAFLKAQSEVDEVSLAEALTRQTILAVNIHQATSNFRTWMAGVAGGGPNSDGRYPLSDGIGNTVLVKCPAQIAADAAGGGGASLDGVYFYTQLSGVTIPAAVKVIKTAGYSAAGLGVAEYTVGDPVAVGTTLPAATRSTRHSANRRPITLIARREVNAHALGGGDEAGLDAAAAAAYDAGGAINKILTADAGMITITGYKDWQNRNIDLWPCVIRAAGDIGALDPEDADDVAEVTPRGLPISRYTLGDPHHAFEDKQKIIGPILDIGGLPAANQHMTRRISFNGQRNSQTQPTVAMRILNDQRAISTYELKITEHLGDGLELKDDTEKKDILLHCSQVVGGYPLTVRSTQEYDIARDRWAPKASTDEIKVRHIHTANQFIYYGQDAVQASITHDCLIESVTPPAGKYAAMVMTRKSEKWIGEIRGCTGRLMKVETRTDGYTVSGCHMAFDLNVIQLLDGDIYIANPKSLTGRLVVNYAKADYSAAGIAGGATLTIGSVRGYCNFAYEARRCTSPSGLDLGDETYDGTHTTGSDGHPVQVPGLSFDNKTITVAIEMGSFEGGNINPNTLWAMRLRAGANSIVNCEHLAGNIEIRKGWQRGVINVPAAWVRSGGSVSKHDLATTQLIIHGAMDLSEVTAIPWKFKGCKVLSVNDFEGIGAEYNGSAWVPMAPVNVPEVSLKALGSPYNADSLKRRGMSLVNRGDAWPYLATGPAREDSWQRPGGDAIVPGLLPQTGAFEGRVIAAAAVAGVTLTAFSPELRLAIDRFFHDLTAGGVYDASDIDASVVKGVWAMMGPNLHFARTNMLFGDWPLTVNGGMTHVAKKGLTPPADPAGAYSEVTGWFANPHGTAKHNIALIGGSEELLNADQSATVAGGPYFTVGCSSGNFRATFHRLDGGNYSQLGTEDSLPAPALNPAVPYRIGMVWTPSSTSQSICMFGGQPVEASKVPVIDNVTGIWFGRSHTSYLRTSISFGGIASGQITPAQVDTVLTAINTLRSALIALP